MEYYTLLNAHGIPTNDVRYFNCLQDGDETILFVELFANQRECPHCHSKNTIIKEYKSKTIKALSTGNKKTFIEYKLPRYLCKECKKTYTHNIISTAEKSLSKQVFDCIIKDFYEMITFSEIARRYNITTNQVIEIFDKNCPNLRSQIEEAICIDEFSNTRKSEDKYSCMLVGFSSHKVIDIIPNRTLPYLRRYFSKQPLFARQIVKYIVTDMYDGYITIAKEFFSNATIAIDPFHYMEYFTNAVQNIRRKLVDDGVYFYDKSWMGKHWRMLTMDWDNLPEENMITQNGTSISYIDRIKRFVNQDNQLRYAYYFLQDFYHTSKKLTYKNAKGYIESTINAMLNSISEELVKCGKTWNNYKEYIINSFIKYNGVRLSNGPIEGLNSRVKTLKKIYCGYHNRDRFIERTILIINKKDK